MHGRNDLVRAEPRVRRSGYSVPLTAGPVSPVVVAHRRGSATTLAASGQHPGGLRGQRLPSDPWRATRGRARAAG